MTTKRLIYHEFMNQFWGGRCAYCLRKLPMKELTNDHIVPKALGGRQLMNLVPACACCNSQKGDANPKLWCTDTQKQHIKWALKAIKLKYFEFFEHRSQAVAAYNYTTSFLGSRGPRKS